MHQDLQGHTTIHGVQALAEIGKGVPSLPRPAPAEVRELQRLVHDLAPQRYQQAA